MRHIIRHYSSTFKSAIPDRIENCVLVDNFKGHYRSGIFSKVTRTSEIAKKEEK